ncbi:MAG: hypothetical protein EU549_01105 [Promethearchaeota archaeon]|nr:MAG: hypothetical protein EU549_01105 [Candidatus Lokiarchaeota archaeon]
MKKDNNIGKSKENKRSKEKIAESMFKWYKNNGFNFPWRKPDIKPFINLVCELMLQRTTTSAVERFFPTIIEKYSNPEDILKANDEELKNDLRFLGLQNKRMKTLKELASAIKTNFDGKVPNDENKLKSIRGIGKYTARAVLCFSFNRRLAFVDSNVRRIITRIFALKNKNDNYIRKKVEELLPKKEYKNFNYALLDLGSLVCSSKNPDCKNCPINENCRFYTNKSYKE